jgi:hypothetical protein
LLSRFVKTKFYGAGNFVNFSSTDERTLKIPQYLSWFFGDQKTVELEYRDAKDPLTGKKRVLGFRVLNKIFNKQKNPLIRDIREVTDVMEKYLRLPATMEELGTSTERLTETPKEREPKKKATLKEEFLGKQSTEEEI